MKLNKEQKRALINGILTSFLNKKLLTENEHTDVYTALKNVDGKLDNITLKSD